MTKDYIKRQFSNFYNEVIKGKFAPKKNAISLSDMNFWTIGILSGDGSFVKYGTRLLSNYIEITEDVHLHIIDNNYEYGLCLFDESHSIFGGKLYYDPDTKERIGGAAYTQRDIYGSELIENQPNAKYARIMLRHIDNTTKMNSSMYDKISVETKFATSKLAEVIHIVEGETKIRNPINSFADIWSRWNARLSFGMSTTTANVPVEVDGQLYVNGTIIAHNTGKQSNNRWSCHILEGYANDNYSRMTMLLNKHNSEFNQKPSLEFYYYTGNSHKASAYGNTKIGSDVLYHSFTFDRDVFTCAGFADFRFPISLANLNPATLDNTYSTIEDLDNAIDPEANATEHVNSLKHIFLKNARNGTMFYDSERNQVVCKINNKWCDIPFTDASSFYDF